MVANRYLHFWAVEGYWREEEVGADRLLTANEAPALRLMCSWRGCVSCVAARSSEEIIPIMGENDPFVRETDEGQTYLDGCLRWER